MLVLKKILIIIIIVAAMYLAYALVNYFKTKIKVHRKPAGFLLLLLLSFSSVFILIMALGFIFNHYRNFFFTH